jgi:hypothetical protein
MPSQYEKGEQIRSLDVLIKQEFIFFHHKVLHQGWFCSWPIRLAMLYLNRNSLFKAVKKNKEENEHGKSKREKANTQTVSG